MSRTGVGTGRVTSQPGGLDCGPACTAQFDYGSVVTLAAVPDAGAVFTGWTGACDGQGATCTLTVTQAVSTNAVFGLPGSSSPAPPAAGGGRQPAPTAGSGQRPAPVAGGDQPSASTAGARRARDTVVAAKLVAARTGRSRLGARLVRVELAAEERLAATLTLWRRGKLLARKRFPAVRAGERVLTLVLRGESARGGRRSGSSSPTAPATRAARAAPSGVPEARAA